MIVGVTRATEGQYKALDKDLQVQMFSFKPGQPPLCLEAEGPSQKTEQTEPEGQPSNIHQKLNPEHYATFYPSPPSKVGDIGQFFTNWTLQSHSIQFALNAS